MDGRADEDVWAAILPTDHGGEGGVAGMGVESVGQRHEELAGDGPAEGAGTVADVVSFGCEVPGDLGFDPEVYRSEAQAIAEPDFLEVAGGDLEDDRFVEREERDDGIDAVEDFGSEEPAHGIGEVFAGGVASGVSGPEPDRAGMEALGAEVGGHDDDAVAEVGDASGGIGQSAIAEELEQQVEEGGVGLFEFVEEDDAEGLFADAGGEESLGASGGGTADESLDGDGIGELVEVEADHACHIAEEEFGGGLGHLCFSGAGGADEEERGQRFAGPGEPGLDHGEEVEDAIDGGGLADDPLGEPNLGFVEVERDIVVEQDGGKAGFA